MADPVDCAMKQIRGLIVIYSEIYRRQGVSGIMEYSGDGMLGKIVRGKMLEAISNQWLTKEFPLGSGFELSEDAIGRVFNLSFFEYKDITRNFRDIRDMNQVT